MRQFSSTSIAPGAAAREGKGGRRSGPDRFAASHLAAGLLGAAAFLPYIAWRGTLTAPDAVVALGAIAPLAAYLLTHPVGLRAAARAVAAAGAAALATTAVAVLGAGALPVLLLLAFEPLRAAWSARERGAVAASMVGLGFGLPAITLWGGVPMTSGGGAPGLAAIAFLLVPMFAAFSIALAAREADTESEAPAEQPVSDALVAAAFDLVTWHDGVGDVVRASVATGAFAGHTFSHGALLARVHLTDRPAFLKALSDAANGDGSVRAEYRLHLGDGVGEGLAPGARGSQVIWVEMRAQRLQAPDRSGALVVAFGRETTARHRHADELERARREAERASELKGRFLATVSHELRTPLNAIIGFSELLAVDHPYLVTEERRKEYALIIRNSGHHLLEIVNTLLDMSKIETGNFTVLPEPFSFGELVSSCCDLMQLKAAESDVELTRELPDDLPEIIADRRACRQILINLLSNAVKFTPAGGDVRVAVRRSGGNVVLSVADTGIGIPETDLPRLGDPFFQAGEVHKRRHEGTGLGLSVVRGLVGLHGGTLSIESGTGAGTTVIIALPLEGPVDSTGLRPAPVHTLSRRAPRAIERKSA